jgi:hypothetical protein
VVRQGNERAEAPPSDVERGQGPQGRSRIAETVSALDKEDLVVEVLDVSLDQMEKDECVICMSAKKETVFYPCGHQCVCVPCGERFRKEARH